MKRAVRVLCLLLVVSAAASASVAAGGRAAPPTYPDQARGGDLPGEQLVRSTCWASCASTSRTGATAPPRAKLSDGKTIPLQPRAATSRRPSPTTWPRRGRPSTTGLMDGWDRIPQCTEAMGYQCLDGGRPAAHPDARGLADQLRHLGPDLRAVHPRVVGGAPRSGVRRPVRVHRRQPRLRVRRGPRVGMRLGSRCALEGSEHPGGKATPVPACIPEPAGAGPVPVVAGPVRPDDHGPAGRGGAHVADLRARAATQAQGYGWAICPTFYECLGSSSRPRTSSGGPTSPPTRRRGSCRTSRS